MQTETGVITVCFAPPANQAALQTTASANAAVAVAVAQSATPAATQQAAAEAGLSVDMMVDGGLEGGLEGLGDMPSSMSVYGEKSAGDVIFDPIEFRIAQSFTGSPKQPVKAPPIISTLPATPVAASPSAAVKTQVSTAGIAVHTNVQGNASVPTSTDQSMTLATGMMDATADFSSTLATAAGIPQTVTSPISSPVSQNVLASQSHPAVQATAAAIIKGAKTEGTQTLSLRLDPPELGKLQVEMKYKKGDPLRVHVVLEKADTASMFQRDSHALENALKDAGLQTDGSSLSFELAKDGGGFQQAMGEKGAETGSLASLSAHADSLTDLPAIDSALDIYTDSRTGITHYNMRV